MPMKKIMPEMEIGFHEGFSAITMPERESRSAWWTNKRWMGGMPTEGIFNIQIDF